MPSSVIRRFHYDAERRALDIEFTSGKVYRYFDVPPEVDAAMRLAGSKGIFFNAAIRDVYRDQPLNGFAPR